MNPSTGDDRIARRVRILPALLARAPWWLAVLVGVLLTTAGGWLVLRPLTALSVLGWYVGLSCVLSGLGDLLPRPGADLAARGSRTDILVGAAWVLVGLAALVVVGRSVDLLGPVIAVALLASGAVALLRLLRDRSAERWLAALVGLAEVAFGLLALLWPDASLIVIAVLFGGRTLLLGLTLLRRGLIARLRRRTADPDDPAAASTARGRTRRGWTRWASAVLVVALAGVTLLVSHSLRDGAPVTDAFYDAPDVLPDEPGTLIRWDAYDGDVPVGMTGYRLLYATTNADGAIVLASAVLAVPTGAAAPAPLITWAHGTVGVTRACAPSIGDDALSSDGTPAVDQLAANGWAMVATDYPGMGTEGDFPYLIGEGEGRAVLDAARAARQVPGVELAGQTAIWGHSQGGHAALWAGQLAATYAPDLDVVGTAALSPASDPEAIAESVLAHPEALGASLAVAYVVDAYTRYYPDLSFDAVVAPSARTLVREAAARCTGQAGTLVTVLAGLAVSRDQPIVATDALDGAFGDLLRANTPTGPWSAPLLLAQGEDDEVIDIAINEQYVADLQASGTDLTWLTYPGGTHMSILAPGQPLTAELIAWTQTRFADDAG
ncbi:MAG TPA: lipase family protein [Cellulomonas sp.]